MKAPPLLTNASSVQTMPTCNEPHSMKFQLRTGAQAGLVFLHHLCAMVCAEHAPCCNAILLHPAPVPRRPRLTLFRLARAS